MRILITTGLYPPEIGGPATYTKMLEAHLPQHGIELVVAPYGWVRKYPRIIRHLVFAFKLIRESRSCNMIYALDPLSVGIPAYIASKITKKPLWLRIAGDYAWEQGQQRFGVIDTLDEFVKQEKRYPLPVQLLRWLEIKVAMHAKRIVVPSDYMKGIVAAWGVPNNQIIRIYSALHPIEVFDSREELRKALEYNGLVVTTAARLVPWKGIHRLIEAIAIVRKKEIAASLVVIGDGPLLEDLKAHAREHLVSDHVRFVGRQSKDALGAAIKASDVFVLNTSYEGLSHQILEVMDLGVPVVTTPVGGNVELVEDGINGLFVPFNDAEAIASGIERAGTHEQLQQNLTQHARATVKKFTEEIVISELVAFLRSEI